jgi:membrane protein
MQFVSSEISSLQFGFVRFAGVLWLSKRSKSKLANMNWKHPSERMPTAETDRGPDSVSAIDRAETWLQQLFPNLRDAGIRWVEDDASSLAASVAYYLALSLFPMMLLLTSGLGIFLQFTSLGRNAEAKILEAIEFQASPVVKVQVEQVLEQLRSQSVVTGPFGLLTAGLAAIGVFVQIDRGFDKIFRIPPRKESNFRRTIWRVIRHRLFAFLMLLCVGGAILGIFVANTVASQLQSVTGQTVPSLKHAFGFFSFVSEYLSNTLLFACVYRWLPKRHVCWSDAFRGGMLASLVWELGRTVLGMFLIGMRYTTAYGAIGSFIAILLWCYYGISILFFGAEYVQVLQKRRETTFPEEPAAEPVEPSYDESPRSEPGRALPTDVQSFEKTQPRRVPTSSHSPGSS